MDTPMNEERDRSTLVDDHFPREQIVFRVSGLIVRRLPRGRRREFGPEGGVPEIDRRGQREGRWLKSETRSRRGRAGTRGTGTLLRARNTHDGGNKREGQDQLLHGATPEKRRELRRKPQVLFI